MPKVLKDIDQRDEPVRMTILHGRSHIAFSKVKIAAFAPIPSASIRMMALARDRSHLT
jgi:hypothetical protein